MNAENHSREIDIILSAIREKVNPDEKIFTEDKTRINWDKLRTLAINHGVLPIVYKYLKKIKKGIVPQDELARFKSVYLQIIKFNLIQSNNLLKVLKLLEEKNINVIPFKGPVLSLQVYGDFCFRISEDLDILIEPEDLSSIYDSMESAGYRSSFPLSGKKKKIWKKDGRDFVFSGSKSFFDFHLRLTQGHSSFGISRDEMREDNFVTIMGHKIRTLSPENTILAMCIHYTKERWNSIKMISDLSYFLYSHSEPDWDKLIQRAKKMGVLKMVLTGFSLLKELMDEKFPEKVEKKISKYPTVKKQSEKYIKALFSGKSKEETFSRITSIANSLDSPQHSLRFIFYFLLSPTPEDFRVINLPEFLYPFYYLLRPLRLLFLAFKRK